jgi:hypothetical protein
MALKRQGARSAKKRRRRDTGKLVAQLAPLEQQDRNAAIKHGAIDGSNHGEGAILVDSPVLPKGIAEDEARGIFGIEPVVMVIVALLLAFIAFIALKISQMPPSP